LQFNIFYKALSDEWLSYNHYLISGQHVTDIAKEYHYYNKKPNNNLINYRHKEHTLKANMVNIVKKLVTINAGHPVSFIVINNHVKHLISIKTASSGQISGQMILINCTVNGRNCTISSLL
jgi:hypothetical protein